MPSVAVIPGWYPGPGRPLDGIFVRDHARAAARDSDVAVLVNDERPPPGRRLFSVEESVEDGLRTFRIRHSRVPQLGTAGYLLGIRTALARLRREGRPVDLLHAHVHRAAWTAMLVGAVARLPFVVSEHSSEWAATGIAQGRAAAGADLVRACGARLSGERLPAAAESRRTGSRRVSVSSRTRSTPSCSRRPQARGAAAPLAS